VGLVAVIVPPAVPLEVEALLGMGGHSGGKQHQAGQQKPGPAAEYFHMFKPPKL
jgi:hypothetical protein